MTSHGGRRRMPCWEGGSGTCFPLHSSPWHSCCLQWLSTRRCRISGLIQALIHMYAAAPPYTGSHTYVCSSAACLLLLAAAAHSAAAARASAVLPQQQSSQVSAVNGTERANTVVICSQHAVMSPNGANGIVCNGTERAEYTCAECVVIVVSCVAVAYVSCMSQRSVFHRRLYWIKIV
jgi:hypothetical protein